MNWHILAGGLFGLAAMLFMFFIVWDLGTPGRLMTFTASQHPIEAPLYVLLCGIAASSIYWGGVGLFKLIKKRRKA